MYQILQKFDIHWHDGGPSIAMMCHLRRVSDLLYNWKSCLLCYMKDVVLHCSIFFKWNKLVRVRVRVRVRVIWRYWPCKMPITYISSNVWVRLTIFSQLPIIQYMVLCVFNRFPCDDWGNIYFFIIIKSEGWTIFHYLGLGHETMICAVFLSIFLWLVMASLPRNVAHQQP